MKFGEERVEAYVKNAANNEFLLRGQLNSRCFVDIGIPNIER